MAELCWILEPTHNPRFPYRVTIRKGQEPVLCLWTQDRWPGQKGRNANWEEVQNKGGEDNE